MFEPPRDLAIILQLQARSKQLVLDQVTVTTSTARHLINTIMISAYMYPLELSTNLREFLLDERLKFGRML